MPLYDAFYGLRGAPFALNPDPRFLFLSRQHREALAGLVYAVADAKGFTLLTGEVGTGKTTVVHSLLVQLGTQVRTALLFNPRLTRRELYRHLLNEFGLPPTRSVLDAIRAIEAFLLAQFARGERTVLVIDEAHVLSGELLEEVRLLSNFETSQTKLLQIVLVGQPELAGRLDSPALRQLRQRIAHRFELRPLGFTDTIDYVRARLATAGRRDELFTAAAYAAVYRFSAGLPRLINVLCDNALVGGFARDVAVVDRPLIVRAARDLRLPRVGRIGIWERLRARRHQSADGVRVPTMADVALRSEP